MPAYFFVYPKRRTFQFPEAEKVFRQVKKVASALHSSGIPFSSFLFPYMDTVQLTENYDTAVYIGDSFFLSQNSGKLSASSLREICARDKGSDFDLEVLELSSMEECRKLFRQYRREEQWSLPKEEAMVAYSAFCRPEEAFSRGFTELQLREFSSRCLALEEICGRQIRLLGGKVYLSANLRFVFSVPESGRRMALKKMRECYREKMLSVYGEGFGSLRFFPCFAEQKNVDSLEKQKYVGKDIEKG